MTARTPQLRLPAAFVRGGTSKGIFFTGGVLPEDPQERDRVLVRALGAGDPYRSEIDGLGGATSSTSKAVVVSRSARPGYDVDYLFAQVEVGVPQVDWRGSCGNLASAVGPFAIDEGLVPATGDSTVVRIWQVNTSKEIVAHVPTADGHAVVDGDFFIDGVPYPGAKIRLDFIDPGGSITLALLPTGNVVDDLDVPGVGRIRATLLDAGNAFVFVHAADLGFRGTESPEEVNGDRAALARLEAVRAAAGVAMGIAPTAEAMTRDEPAAPKIAFVAAPAAYRTPTGRAVDAGEIDLVVRMISMGRLHHALPGTGGVGIGLAAQLPGTLPHAVSRRPEGLLRIGHTSGVIPVEAILERSGESWVAKRATVWRTARRLMDGAVLVPHATGNAG